MTHHPASHKIPETGPPPLHHWAENMRYWSLDLLISMVKIKLEGALAELTRRAAQENNPEALRELHHIMDTTRENETQPEPETA